MKFLHRKLEILHTQGLTPNLKKVLGQAKRPKGRAGDSSITVPGTVIDVSPRFAPKSWNKSPTVPGTVGEKSWNNMIQIDKALIDDLFAKAEASDRKRMNYDLRTSAEDNSQRMLNALLPGTVVPIHRHPMSNENVLCLCGKLVEILYEELDPLLSLPSTGSGQVPGDDASAFERGMDAQYVMNGKRLKEVERVILDPSTGSFGCVVPAGVWHTVEVLEPSVIYEAKDGAYGSDGSESF